MQVDHPAGARACAAAIRALLAAAVALDDAALVGPSRCPGWSRLNALMHVHLGLQDMLLGMVSPAEAEPDVDAATYWRTDPPSNDASADPIDHISFLHRFSTAYQPAARRGRPPAAHGRDRGRGGGADDAGPGPVPGPRPDHRRLPGHLGDRAGGTPPRPRPGPGCPGPGSGGPPAGPADRRGPWPGARPTRPPTSRPPCADGTGWARSGCGSRRWQQSAVDQPVSGTLLPPERWDSPEWTHRVRAAPPARAWAGPRWEPAGDRVRARASTPSARPLAARSRASPAGSIRRSTTDRGEAPSELL